MHKKYFLINLFNLIKELMIRYHGKNLDHFLLLYFIFFVSNAK
jgi:hypothetical protein